MAKTTQQRRNEIYRIIVSQGSARVSELAEQLQVTTETIRKDLNSMDEQGIIIKNHGGAEIKNTYYQLPLDVKMSEHVYEKQLIARRALDFIQDNTVLFLDPGSTILYLAKYLRLRKGLTVVTNSLAIASMVSETTHQLMIAGDGGQAACAAEGTAEDSVMRFLQVSQILLIYLRKVVRLRCIDNRSDY